MLSWEFPPLVVGGIARHVHDLSLSLARQGIEVTVLTAGGSNAPQLERQGNLTIHRVVAGNPSPQDFIGQIMQLNLNLLERALALVKEGRPFSLVHAHDWVTAYAGKALKHGLELPLLATIHATEWGRNNGLHNEMQRHISSVEWWLGYEAWRVICCSKYMAAELRQVFQLPKDKLRIIPNGVNREESSAGPVPPGFRDRYAAPGERIIFHVGRLVREKGLDVLLEALPRILSQYPQAKLIIAGRGGHAEALKEHARQLGIYHRIYFTGYLDDHTRNLLYGLADVAVFPSLYEPFGIVALEAMAAGAPPVVSDTGGMSEIVVHGRNGLKAQTGNAISLAENVLWALQRPEQMARMRRQGLEDIGRLYDWNDIARQTRSTYEEVLTEREARPIEVMSAFPIDREDQYDRYGQAMA